jgi:membrane-bound inhibitor of C-type lysozyme
MTMSISRLVLACAVALGVAASASAVTPTPAASASATASTPAKKPAKAASKAKAKPAPVVEATPEEAEPDVADTVTTEYACELGNKITIFKNDNDDAHIALRWKKRLHRLTRVGTTTGAQRFENPVYGLIWIGIPTKGMLLDSKLNRQLANECKTAEPAVVVKQG